jgi:PAS domain S-box-containing protein
MIPPAPPRNPLSTPACDPSPRPATQRPAQEVRLICELFDQAPGCMIVFTGADHEIQMANPALLAFTGLGPEIVGQAARLAMPRGFSRGFGQLLDEVYKTGKPRFQKNAKLLVTRYPGGPDEEAFADFILQPLRDAHAVVYGVFCQGHEVTVEKLAADELRASREQLRDALEAAQAILDNSHDIICVVGLDGRFKEVNKHAERLWGYRPEEMIGRSYLAFMHPDERAAGSQLARQISAGVAAKPFTCRHLHKNGTVIPVMWSAVRSESKDSIISIGRDMRDHIANEEKLRQAQKMEAVGRLTGGIAHDFNNLLTVVIGSTEALADGLEDSPELQSIARLALDAAERGAELVSRLLAFARTQPLAPQTVDCKNFLDALAPILQRTIGREIEVTVEKPRSHDLQCVADLTQLTSAMLNLCINARDAMPNGGRLTVRATCEEPADAETPAYVVFCVEDTGEGMSEETRARALEPFFTTKPEGQGSGLGLSMVHGFASQSGGRLEIESEPTRGTCMRIYLPRTTKPQERADAPPPVAVWEPPRHVLLVEDDDLLRGQVARQLNGLGCQVTALGNGRDALTILETLPEIDLLMTDIAMPGGMNGRQLADHARRLNPGLRILFTSGHTDEATIRALREDGMAGFIGKPYRRAELARTLAKIFQDPSRGLAAVQGPGAPTAATIAENNASMLMGLETTSVMPAAR